MSLILPLLLVASLFTNLIQYIRISLRKNDLVQQNKILKGALAEKDRLRDIIRRIKATNLN